MAGKGIRNKLKSKGRKSVCEPETSSVPDGTLAILNRPPSHKWLGFFLSRKRCDLFWGVCIPPTPTAPSNPV